MRTIPAPEVGDKVVNEFNGEVIETGEIYKTVDDEFSYYANTNIWYVPVDWDEGEQDSNTVEWSELHKCWVLK